MNFNLNNLGVAWHDQEAEYQVHQQEGHQLFFDVHFSSLFTTYLSLYYHIGTSTFLNTRHNLYKYVLFSFFYLFSRKDWKKAQISYFHPS